MLPRSEFIASAAAAAVIMVSATSARATLSFTVGGNWDTTGRKAAATAAMQDVVNGYNRYGDFGNYNIYVYYDPGIPTAQSNYLSSIGFGGTYPNDRVAQHESNHYLGSGTTNNWSATFSNAVWTGPKMNALAAQFDGDGALIRQAGVHFYPYGLNYDTEVVNADVLMRNIALMYAQRQDDGLGNPADPWRATVVHLKQSDPVGTSAFNWYGAWDDGYYAHPNAAYYTGNYILRTPLDTYNPGGATPGFHFVGQSLSVNNTNGASGGLVFQGHGAASVLTFSNLILNGGYVKHASGAGDMFQIGGHVTLASTATLDAAQGDIRILATVGGNGALHKVGPHVLTLAGAASYTQGTRLSAGTLLAGTPTSLGSGVLSLYAGTFGTTAALIIPNPIDVIGSGAIGYAGQANNLTLSGPLTGGGTLQNFMGSSGNYNVQFSGNLSGFTGTLSYTCDTNAATGGWRIGTANLVTDLSHANLVIHQGNLTDPTASSKNVGFADGISGATVKIGALSGDGVFQAAYNNVGPNVLEVGALNTDATFSGVIGGGNAGTRINIDKVGTGVWTLTGNNLYTGRTSIAGGAVRANNLSGSATGTGPVTVAAGATLGGSGTIHNIGGPVSINAQASITAGADAATPGTLHTASQAWYGQGEYLAKVSPDGASHDRLWMTSLILNATPDSPFVIHVTSSGSPMLAASGPNSALILATDADPSADNPFALPAELANLSLTVTGLTSATGRFKLAGELDPAGGYDLVLQDLLPMKPPREMLGETFSTSSGAVPEPTSFFLFPIAGAASLARRRSPKS